MTSPYSGVASKDWEAKTQNLIESHPLKKKELVEIILTSWKSIFSSSIGRYKIGKDFFPKPQIMGFFLHELMTLEFERRYPKQWRGDKSKTDKDLVYIPNDSFSIEIKTSSSRNKIYANRSYAQQSTDAKKTKSGYYTAINFEGFKISPKKLVQAKIVLIRFGWLDHSDWVGQASPTGQQASLKAESEKAKLVIYYSNDGSVKEGEDVFEIDDGAAAK